MCAIVQGRICISEGATLVYYVYKALIQKIKLIFYEAGERWPSGKNTYCSSSRGPQFGSQRTDWMVHSLLQPALGDPMPLASMAPT